MREEVAFGLENLGVPEPTTGQDARGVDLSGRVIPHVKTQGRTVVVVSHDIDFVADHFPCVVVMADGPAVFVLPQSDLLAQVHVDPPQLICLAAALQLPEAPTTVEAFPTLDFTHHVSHFRSVAKQKRLRRPRRCLRRRAQRQRLPTCFPR